MSQATVTQHLKDPYLLMILLGLTLLSSAMLLGLCLGDPFHLPLMAFDSMSDYQYCTSKYELIVNVPLTLSTRFALLLLTTICAYKIRKLPGLFSETRQLVFAVYNLSFLSVAVPVIDLTMDRGKTLGTIAHGVAIFAICILTALIMFVPKLILVIKMDKPGKCSSSTFVFNRTNSSPLTNTHSCPATQLELNNYRENQSKLRKKRLRLNGNQNNLNRSYSSP